MVTEVIAPESIEQDAAWFAENSARFWKTIYRLRSYCTENGPIRLPSGKAVGYFADGSTWDAEAVAQVMPNLVAETEASVIGSKQDVERALSVVLEEVPGLRIGTVKYTLDRDALNGVMRVGGEAAERLAPFKQAKSKLGVK